MSKNFQVFRSSAGSGKTYTLSLSFIALALQGGRFGYADYYKKILAITFTNKAAAEMKERVLEYLDTLSKQEDKDGVLDWLLEKTDLNKDEIFNRAAIVYKHILHHYADLGISTIDKFTYKIVRTFASDLDLTQNFDLELDSYKIIQPVVALLLGKMSDCGGDLSNALVNFAMEKAEDGKSINIERDLEDFSAQLFKEEVAGYTNGKRLTIKQCMQVKKNLQLDKEIIKRKVDNLADRVCVFFDVNGLTKDHFLRGTFYKYFTENVGHQQDKKWNPTDALMRSIANDIWYADGKKDEIKDLVDGLKPNLKQFFAEMLNLLTEYNSAKAILKNIYSIAILNELMNEIRIFKKENNIVQISEFNQKIHNIVTEEPSSFIYERLGERYNHYLIDEFQDTSLLQWQNILPLITDSLDYGKSIVVGDGKQSIYRWRGGEVEQFSHLPKIYKGEDLIFKKDWENKLESHFESDNLLSNFRSRRNIVEFNNQFFENTRSLLSNDILDIYDDQEQKSAFAKEGGYVHVALFGDKERDFKALILKKMVDEIHKLVDKNNYSYNDVTILCNSRRGVALVAEALSLAKIPVISNEGLLISKSDKVNTLIALLCYLQNPKDAISKSVISAYLFANILVNENLHTLNLMAKTEAGFNELLKQANVFINTEKLLKEPLYEMVEELIRLFNFDEDVYLQFFLDFVLAFSETKGGSLSVFLLWWEERKYIEAIVIPEGTNAVQIMTIHKSKGLAFNVVMIPFNWQDRKKTTDIWVDTSDYFNKQLPVALINGNKQLEQSYFSSEYQKEKEMSLLDSLNKLYVAMTRPRERLYIFSKSFPDKISDDFKKKGDLNSFLYAYDDNFPIEIGDANMMHDSSEKIESSFLVAKGNKLNWKEVISLKHTAEAIWDIDSVNEKRDWGKLLHLVLSEIHYLNQKEKVIESFYNLGKCSKDDAERLKITINQFLSNKNISSYFNENWKVKTEKEILMKNGRTYIPDRLLFAKNTDEVVVIDYKTGAKSNKHESQINDYASALYNMGYKNTKRVLVYITNEIKVEVL